MGRAEPRIANFMRNAAFTSARRGWRRSSRFSQMWVRVPRLSIPLNGSTTMARTNRATSSGRHEKSKREIDVPIDGSPIKGKQKHWWSGASSSRCRISCSIIASINLVGLSIEPFNSARRTRCVENLVGILRIKEKRSMLRNGRGVISCILRYSSVD